MSKVILKPKQKFKIPVEAEKIIPAIFAGKSQNELEQLLLWEGNRQRFLGELFEVEGKTETDPKNFSIHIVGDIEEVKRIGSEMVDGEIVIDGNVGMHLGEEMEGGIIRVNGDAGSWTGSMMKGGLIEIKGNVDDYIGSSYRGSVRGMSGGTIIVHGNAGNEAGCYMKKGFIKILGNVKQYLGVHMDGGTILVQGNSNGRAGAQMTRGKIIICGHIPSVLPSFTFEDIRKNAKAVDQRIKEPFYLFTGDITEKGKGRLFISKSNNPQLTYYEKFLE